MQDRKIKIIGYDSGWGCLNPGCADGPEALDINLLADRLRKAGVHVTDTEMLDLKKLGDRAAATEKTQTFPQVVDSLQRLYASVLTAQEQEILPLVIGGDHTSAMATWAAAAQDRADAFGLIWIDAHMDAHTPETAHQGKWGGWWHGMPLATLTGDGPSEFTALGAGARKIDPAHICLIGVRSFEPGEKDYVTRHGITVFDLEQVQEQGFAKLYAKALEIATNGTRGFGLSIDLDAFDPAFAPGVGTREENGLNPRDVLPIIQGTAAHPLFSGLEIVEYNPHNDIENRTAKLAQDIAISVFAKSSN